VPVLVFSDEQGKVCAVLFSYACHPTARDGLKVGGDYVGYALDAVAEAFPDAQPIFLQGCAGDQKPRASSSAEAGFGTHSLDSVRALGVELGSAVVSAVRRAEPIDGRVRANFDAVLLQNEAVDVDAVSAGLQSSERYIRRWAEKWHEELENDGENHTEMPLELQTITIGTDLALVGMGAEMTVEHGLRLKREHGDQFKTVVPLGYTNTMIGYVPVERQIDEGGYEVLDANQYWGYSGPFVRDSEDRIHSKIGAMISELVD
jgi:hypothetical protein